jgi:hypothetical protein
MVGFQRGPKFCVGKKNQQKLHIFRAPEISNLGIRSKVSDGEPN